MASRPFKDYEEDDVIGNFSVQHPPLINLLTFYKRVDN